MPVRWVICPVIQVGAFTRTAKVSRIVDPGNTLTTDPDGNPITPIPLFYRTSMVIHDSDNSWCVAFVRGEDMSALDDDPDVISILGRDHEDFENFLDESPESQGWNRGQINALERLLSNHEVDTTGLDATSPFWQWIERLGRARNVSFRPRGTWVR